MPPTKDPSGATSNPGTLQDGSLSQNLWRPRPGWVLGFTGSYVEQQHPNALKQWRKESGAETVDHSWAPAQDIHGTGGVAQWPSPGSWHPTEAA